MEENYIWTEVSPGHNYIGHTYMDFLGHNCMEENYIWTEVSPFSLEQRPQ